MTAILLFGSNGQLGARLTAALTYAGYEVTALDRAQFDFAEATAKQVETTLRAVEPALIINAVAYTAVDKAESQYDLALRINGEMPRMLAEAAKAAAIPFLHFSTDYVFDGVRGRYTESAPTNPLNAYGETKLAGEEGVSAAGGHVFRLQWVYDTRGQNFLRTMQKLLAEKPALNIVADQMGAPSSARDLAHAVTQAVPLIMASTLPAGVYHLTAAGYTSWHGFTCAIAKLLNHTIPIHPITSAEYPLPATRPLDGRLDCSALAAHGIALPHWQDGLKTLLTEHSL